MEKRNPSRWSENSRVHHISSRHQQHGNRHTQQHDAKASAAAGVFLIADELLGVLLAAPSGMALRTIELPEAISPRLDRPRVMPKRPPASAAPIRLARRFPERPLQPPNQQEDNHHDRPHRQIDQSVIAVVHRPSDRDYKYVADDKQDKYVAYP